jgi:hypothetical protein
VERQKVSVYKMPAGHPGIKSLFESITPYFDSDMQPAGELSLGVVSRLRRVKNKAPALRKSGDLLLAAT